MVWNFNNGLTMKIFTSFGYIKSIVISEDDKSILSGEGDRKIRIWSLSKYKKIKTIFSHI